MHRYLVIVPKYFGSQFRFEVEAEDEDDAVRQVEERISTMPGRENIDHEGRIFVEKLKPSFDEKYEWFD